MPNLLNAIRVNCTSDTEMNSAALTYTLGADLAVAFRALTGECTDRVDALLAGLTVVFVSLALIHICIGGETRTCRCEIEVNQTTLSLIGANLGEAVRMSVVEVEVTSAETFHSVKLCLPSHSAWHSGVLLHFLPLRHFNL